MRSNMPSASSACKGETMTRENKQQEINRKEDNFRRMLGGCCPFSFWFDELREDWARGNIYFEE